MPKKMLNNYRYFDLPIIYVLFLLHLFVACGPKRTSNKYLPKEPAATMLAEEQQLTRQLKQNVLPDQWGTIETKIIPVLKSFPEVLHQQLDVTKKLLIKIQKEKENRNYPSLRLKKLLQQTQDAGFYAQTASQAITSLQSWLKLLHYIAKQQK
jgi:hypothetical protein